MPRRDGRVRVEDRIGHPCIHARVDKARDAEDAAAPRVQRADHAVRAHAVRLRVVAEVRIERPLVRFGHKHEVEQRLLGEHAALVESTGWLEPAAAGAQHARPLVEVEQLLEACDHIGNGRARVGVKIDRLPGHDAHFQLDVGLQADHEVDNDVILHAELAQRHALLHRLAFENEPLRGRRDGRRLLDRDLELLDTVVGLDVDRPFLAVLDALDADLHRPAGGGRRNQRKKQEEGKTSARARKNQACNSEILQHAKESKDGRK